MNNRERLSFGERFSIALATFMRALLRLILILFIAALLGGGLYLGFVYFYQNAVIPAQESLSRISILETRQADNQDQVSRRLDAFQQRLAALEDQSILDRQALDELLTDQVRLQTEIDAHDARLQELDALQADLQAVRLETGKALALAEENQARLDSGDPRLDELQREITLLRVAALINRSRLSLLQSNYGMAAQEVELARQLLADLQPGDNRPLQSLQAAWLGRLDSALDHLPESPLLASDDLEIVWKMIITQGLSGGVELYTLPFLFTVTPTPAQTQTPQGEGTSQGTVTPIPLLTVTATASPTGTP